MSLTATPRAVRNANPLNIVKGSPWQGLLAPELMTPEQAAEDRFCVFAAPRWGFRAAAVTLLSYYDRYNIDSVTGVLMRWAPPSENDTKSYIGFVCAHSGFHADEILDLHAYDVVFKLLKAMSQEEAGGWYFTDEDLESGLRSTGIVPVQGPFVADRGIPPKLIAAGATAGGGVFETLSNARDQIGQYAYVFSWGAKIMIGLTLAIIGYQLYKHIGYRKSGLR